MDAFRRRPASQTRSRKPFHGHSLRTTDHVLVDQRPNAMNCAKENNVADPIAFSINVNHAYLIPQIESRGKCCLRAPLRAIFL